MTNVVVIGPQHWHTGGYIRVLKDMSDVKFVGVSDPDPAVAKKYATDMGCPAFADYRDMCGKLKPDFAVAMGRHCDMAAEAEFLMNEGIPFLMEKPCGVNLEEVSRLAELARRKQAFAAIPFSERQGPMIDQIRDRLGFDKLHYVMFNRILGTPARYLENGNPWMLDPVQAGGGCTLNLSVHWLDLFQYFMGPGAKIEITSATMSNAAYRLPIEDYSLVALRSGQTECIVETGYLFPSQLDMHYSIQGDRGYLIFPGPGHDAEFIAPDGKRETIDLNSGL
ncbi:MAG: Gfo/Idh/MocA family oxidoreductase, partial [Phycisphaerales bacterium]|nr:Gfo/Idh/MocA family oxidoreductase [Phycisphaerales bacterium]